jgi:photosystem II stability/assembly factor-like uncharacterized protein
MKRNVLILLAIAILSVGQSRADAVIDWNATAITVMLRVPTLARSPNNDMAYVHVAIYDAVNAIDGRYSVFAVAPSNAAPWASKEAATAAAARRVLLTFYPSQQPYIDSVYAAVLALLPNDYRTTGGIAIGDTVATRFLALRAGDGRDAVVVYSWLPPAPGVYQPTPPGAAQYQPLNPWLAQLQPFSVTSPSQFRAPGPPEFTSDAYTRDFNEVKRYGSLDSSFTTPQQREIARFYTENPNVQLARNIRLFAASRAMSLADNARLFAQIYVTIGDALITGFESKYLYNNWRPVTAIRAADSDGNSLTSPDTSWRPLVPTPPHPEYVAAHGCALGGFAYALKEFFGTTGVPVTLTSTVTGVPHPFNNINEIITETINARVFGGMHFRSSVEDGVTIGHEVAAWVARRHFIPLGASPWGEEHAIGLPGSPDADVVFSPVSEKVCWGIKNTNFDFIRTTDGGTTWSTSVVGGASGLVGSTISAVDANTAYVAMLDPSGVSSGGIFKTTDGGTSWTKQTTAFPSPGGVPNSIHFFDAPTGVCEGDPNGGYWEIYTTTDGGSHWNRVPYANIPSPVAGDVSTGVNFASVGSCVWFGTEFNSVYRSTDKGMTWSVARNVMGSGNYGPYVAFRDSLNGLGCLPFTNGAGNRISRTTDGGITWQPLAASSVPATPSAYFPACVPGTHTYVITSNRNSSAQQHTVPGSAYSTDDGLTWTQIDNLPHSQAAFVSPHVGWSGGTNDLIYKWDNNLLVSSVTQAKGVVESFRLEQNYPNPFNPTTKIQFTLVDRQLTIVNVFDMLGREVAALVNEVKEPGTYTVQFDASGLASGVYLYRLTAGSFVQTRKMIVVR